MVKNVASFAKTNWLLLLVVAFVAGVRLHLADMPMERDEGEYSYAGQCILRGEAPYKSAYNMKLPGTYAAYAAIMAVFGQSPTGIRIGVTLVNAASIVLVFLIGRRLLDQTTGLVAAVCFALLSLSPSVFGLAGHATHFLVLPALGGILLLAGLTQRRRDAEVKEPRLTQGREDAGPSEDVGLRTEDLGHRTGEQRTIGPSDYGTIGQKTNAEPPTRPSSQPVQKQPRKTFIALKKEAEARKEGEKETIGPSDQGTMGLRKEDIRTEDLGKEGQETNVEHRTSNIEPSNQTTKEDLGRRTGTKGTIGPSDYGTMGHEKGKGDLGHRTALAAEKARSAKEARQSAKIEAGGATFEVRFSAWELAGGGLLMGLAFLMKQHGVFFGLFGVLWIGCAHFIAHREKVRAFRQKVRNPRPGESGPGFPFSKAAVQVALFSAGFVLPYALTCLLLWMSGVFPQFWFWTVEYAREYAAAIPLVEGPTMLKLVFGAVVGPNSLLWLLAVAGLVVMWTDHRLSVPSRVFVVALGICAVASVSVGLYFRGHYFIPLLPVLGLLGGIAISRSLWLIRNDRSIELFMAIAIMIILTVGIPLSIIGNGATWFTSPVEATRASYNTTLFDEAAKVARYIQKNADPKDRVAVIGSEPQIYFLSKRRAATGYIYMYPLMEKQPFALRMQEEMIAEIEKSRPEWVVYVGDRFSWLAGEHSHRHLLDWWETYSQKELNLVEMKKVVTTPGGDADMEALAAKMPQETSRTPQGTITLESEIMIFRRK